MGAERATATGLRGGGDFDGWVSDYLASDPPAADAGTPTIDEDGICGSTYGTTDNGADWSTCFTSSSVRTTSPS